MAASDTDRDRGDAPSVRCSRAKLPVLIDLYADWCAPCKVLDPRVAEVAQEYAGKLKVVKVDVDKSPRIAQMFQARSIPMLVLIVGGRPAGVLQGAVAKHEIVDLISPHLPGAQEEVPAAELAKLLKARRVMALDVRDAGPFARAHIPGAVNIPAVDVAGRVKELAAKRLPVIVYDRSGGDDASGGADRRRRRRRGFRPCCSRAGFSAGRAKGST